MHMLISSLVVLSMTNRILGSFYVLLRKLLGFFVQLLQTFRTLSPETDQSCYHSVPVPSYQQSFVRLAQVSFYSSKMIVVESLCSGSFIAFCLSAKLVLFQNVQNIFLNRCRFHGSGNFFPAENQVQSLDRPEKKKLFDQKYRQSLFSNPSALEATFVVEIDRAKNFSSRVFVMSLSSVWYNNY